MPALTIPSLEKKYEHFTVPVFYIMAGESKLEGADLLIENLSVVITSGYEASSCSFEVSSDKIYYLRDGGVTKHALLDKALVVGSKLEVKIGYKNADGAVVVFKGFITSVEYLLDGKEGFRYYISGMDFKIFMMNNMRSELKKDVKKYSDAVSGILKDYRSMMDGDSIEQTDELTIPIEQHRQSDYEFVVDLAKRVNFQFYVICGKVYFESYTKNSDSQLTVSPGKYLYKFRREITLDKQIAGVVVRTNNEQDPEKPIEAKVTTVDAVGDGQKTSKQVSKLIGDKMLKTIIDNSVTSEKEAQARATAELLKASLEFVSGEIETVGIPELIPGKYVTIENINDIYDQKYYITEVTHSINTSGFRTRCRFGVNKA